MAAWRSSVVSSRGELAGAQLVDGGAPVGRAGGKQVVEFAATVDQLVVGRDDGVGGVDAVAGGEPGAGDPKPDVQPVPRGTFGRVGPSAELGNGVGELVAGSPTSNVADSIIPGGGTGDVGGPPAEQAGEPAGRFGGQGVGETFEVAVDGAVVAAGVARFDADGPHGRLPVLDAVG
jgi:hypothetical protein